MKVVYQSDDLYLIEINRKKYYYGNGDNINAFGKSAVQFLRFNPYIEDVAEKKIAIPQKIIDYIKNN